MDQVENEHRSHLQEKLHTIPRERPDDFRKTIVDDPFLKHQQ